MIDYKVLCSQVFNIQRYVTNVKVVNQIAFLNTSSRVLTKQFSSVVPDAIDGFADKLVEDKVRKWKHINSCKKTGVPLSRAVVASSESRDAELEKLAGVDAECRKQWVSAALKAGRHKDVVSLVRLCSSRRLDLPPDCLLETAGALARRGDVEGVGAVKALARRTNMYEYRAQAGYDHYLAEASWTSGRLHEALSLLTRVYTTHPGLHNKVRAMSRFLVGDVLSRRGEAALVLLTDFARSMASEHRDYHFLAALWQACFLSAWFADQTLAANMLREHPQLRTTVEARALELSFVLLKTNRSEHVYRLLEVLLLYEMKTVYSQVLRALFDHKCERRDVQACCNIVHCCQHLGVPLTAGQQHNFILLVVNERPASKDRRADTPPHFTLKF